MTKEKDLSIETLRGLAILLVVSGYITRYDILPLDPLNPSFSYSFIKYSEFALAMLRMALFTVISSFLYAAAPAAFSTYPKLVRGKFRRILIPFFVFSTLQFLFFAFIPGSQYDLRQIFRAYLWPSQQLWFLFSVFNIFILAGLLDCLNLLGTLKRFLIFCGISIVLHMLFEMPGIFSIYGSNYLLPYFLLGYGMRRYPGFFMPPSRIGLLSVIFLISFSIAPLCHFITGSDKDLPFHFRRMLDILIPFSGLPVLFYFRRPIPLLAFFGYYAFGIHLFHRVAVTSLRLCFPVYILENPAAVLALYLTGGTLIALGLQALFEKTAVTRILILGMKKEEKPKSWREMLRPGGLGLQKRKNAAVPQAPLS